MLDNTIIFLLKNAVNNREEVEYNIGKTTIKGLSNILHASSNVPETQVIFMQNGSEIMEPYYETLK